MNETKVFRAHHQTLPGSLPEITGLLREWVDLNATTATTAAIARWNEPAFPPGTRPGDIVDAIDDADTSTANELTLSLLRIFQAGNSLAGRILLQEFLPNLWRMKSAAGGHDHADRLQAVIAEFWTILSAYPLARTDRCVGARIVLDTLNAVTRSRDRLNRQLDEIPVEDDVLATLANHHPTANHVQTELTDLVDLDTLVAWARRNEIIDSTDQTLLLTALGAEKRVMDIEAACTATGLSNAAARRRLSRTRTRLIDAARRELQRGTLHAVAGIDAAGPTLQRTHS